MLESSLPLIAGLVIALFAAFTVLRAARIVPQARARNVERLGRYHRTLHPGLNFVIPYFDRVYPMIDLREQVVSFQPQPVITEDNLVVEIDTVLYFQVTDARAAAYEIASFLQGVEQLTVTTLRNPSRTRWRSRCGPSATSVRQSWAPKANGSLRSLPPRVTSRRPFCAPRATGPHRS